MVSGMSLCDRNAMSVELVMLAGPPSARATWSIGAQHGRAVILPAPLSVAERTRSAHGRFEVVQTTERAQRDGSARTAFGSAARLDALLAQRDVERAVFPRGSPKSGQA
jgi:hypothetical protein